MNHTIIQEHGKQLSEVKEIKLRSFWTRFSDYFDSKTCSVGGLYRFMLAQRIQRSAASCVHVQACVGPILDSLIPF